jgi:hypothetical protein
MDCVGTTDQIGTDFAGLTRRPDVLRPAIDRNAGAVIVDLRGELGRQDDLIAATPDGRTDLTPSDITTTVWALRGVVNAASRAGGSAESPWRSHLGHVLNSFHGEPTQPPSG